MNDKWKCISETCEWIGNEPNNVDPYEDGGWHECPKCGDAAVLNFNHPDNQRKYAEALRRSNT